VKAKLVVMFRALKSGELFVEEGTVAVMRLGNRCVMVAAKKKASVMRGGRMRPLTSEHDECTLSGWMSEADIPWKRRRVHRLTAVTWSSRTAKAAKGCCNKKREVRWLRRRRIPNKRSY
jgi:hypothetical protein